MAKDKDKNKSTTGQKTGVKNKRQGGQSGEENKNSGGQSGEKNKASQRLTDAGWLGSGGSVQILMNAAFLVAVLSVNYFFNPHASRLDNLEKTFRAVCGDSDLESGTCLQNLLAARDSEIRRTFDDRTSKSVNDALHRENILERKFSETLEKSHKEHNENIRGQINGIRDEVLGQTDKLVNGRLDIMLTERPGHPEHPMQFSEEVKGDILGVVNMVKGKGLNQQHFEDLILLSRDMSNIILEEQNITFLRNLMRNEHFINFAKKVELYVNIIDRFDTVKDCQLQKSDIKEIIEWNTFSRETGIKEKLQHNLETLDTLRMIPLSVEHYSELHEFSMKSKMLRFTENLTLMAQYLDSFVRLDLSSTEVDTLFKKFKGIAKTNLEVEINDWQLQKSDIKDIIDWNKFGRETGIKEILRHNLETLDTLRSIPLSAEHYAELHQFSMISRALHFTENLPLMSKYLDSFVRLDLSSTEVYNLFLKFEDIAKTTQLRM